MNKCDNEKNTHACTVGDDYGENLETYVIQNGCSCSFDSENLWIIPTPIDKDIKSMIEKHGVPLKEWDVKINRGILTGFNDAFIIDGEKRKELITEDPRSAEIIQPVLTGKDIKRYGFVFADSWLIATFPSKRYNIDDYPAIKRYLLSFDIRRLEQTGKSYKISENKNFKARKKTSNKWFETQDSINYWDEFSKRKIIYPETAQHASFYIDSNGIYLEKTCYMMISDSPEYLVATLSSKLYEYAFKRIYSSIELGKNGFQYRESAVEKIPVKPVEQINKEILSDIVESVNRQQEYYAVNKRIDDKLDVHINNLIYDIYEISSDERKYIESYISR